MTTTLDWLLDANRTQADRISELEADVARLHVTIVNLRRRISQAKRVQANWLIRQQAWRDERDELLRKLGPDHSTPSTIALRNWGPGS